MTGGVTFTVEAPGMERTPEEWHARCVDARRIADRHGAYADTAGRCGLSAFGGAVCSVFGAVEAPVLYRGAAYWACGAHADLMRRRFLAAGEE